jgi:hypothetical protein
LLVDYWADLKAYSKAELMVVMSASRLAALKVALMGQMWAGE